MKLNILKYLWVRAFKWDCASLAPQASVSGHGYDTETALENCGSFLRMNQCWCSLVPFLITSFFSNFKEFILNAWFNVSSRIRLEETNIVVYRYTGGRMCYSLMTCLSLWVFLCITWSFAVTFCIVYDIYAKVRGGMQLGSFKIW